MTHEEIDIMWQQAMRQSIEEGEMFTRYHFAKLVAEKALAQPEPILSLQCFHCQDTIETLNDKVMHLLAQRTWVGLTDEDRQVVFYDCGVGKEYDISACQDELRYARAIEAKLKEKNA